MSVSLGDALPGRELRPVVAVTRAALVPRALGSLAGLMLRRLVIVHDHGETHGGQSGPPLLYKDTCCVAVEMCQSGFTVVMGFFFERMPLRLKLYRLSIHCKKIPRNYEPCARIVLIDLVHILCRCQRHPDGASGTGYKNGGLDVHSG